MGETRLNLFRIEYEEDPSEGEHVQGKLRFWYVGCVHDLVRPAGGPSASFFKYAENFMHVVKDEKEEGEDEQPVLDALESARVARVADKAGDGRGGGRLRSRSRGRSAGQKGASHSKEKGARGGGGGRRGVEESKIECMLLFGWLVFKQR